MVEKDGYSESRIDSAGRQFAIRVMRFDNGAFVSIYEGAPKIGSTVVSIRTSETPATTSVIPSKTDSLLLKFIAEMVSSKTRGIAMVSVSAQSEIPSATSREILTRITDMIQ